MHCEQFKMQQVLNKIKYTMMKENQVYYCVACVLLGPVSLSVYYKGASSFYHNNVIVLIFEDSTVNITLSNQRS